ncbi:MAG: Tetratricopeptide 2 repeat protein [Rhodospirillales bacterium]|nr:Tetratricopeptide 2 repeat protein [Rhodospirillales bacterium]
MSAANAMPPGQRELRMARQHLVTGRMAEAVVAFEQAATLGAPLAARAHDHALALSNAGRHDAAEALLRQAIAEPPLQYGVLLLMGVVLKRAGRLRESIGFIEQARDLNPEPAAAWHNLGNTLSSLGEAPGAATAYAEVVKRQPEDAGSHRLLGQALRDCGRHDEAVQHYARGRALRPTDVELFNEALLHLISQQRHDDAKALVAEFERANGPGAVPTMLEARRLLRSGEREAGIALLRAWIAGHTDDPRPYTMLANALGDADREAANILLREALAHHPQAVDIAITLCESLNRTRGPAEAENIQGSWEIARDLTDRNVRGLLNHALTLRSVFKRTADLMRLEKIGPIEAIAPSWVATNRLAGLHNELGNVATLEDRLRLVDWHREWGQRLQGRVAPLRGPLAVPWVKGSRKIRVGFMSSDLRHHPVSYFALHLLELFDRDRFEVFCYSFYEKNKDQVQAHIESKVTGFRWWPHTPDHEVARRIQDDKLDILFELGGSTAMNKLEVMAYKPARLGASWLGYPHSAGIERIDYILTDPYLAPEDPRLLVERQFRMPESWVALGRVGFIGVPITDEIPELRNKRLTFGTMNNPMKYSGACFDAWALVMRQVPSARFLFVRPEGGAAAFRDNVGANFAARGVDAACIEYVPVRGDHLKYYNEIDVALDTFPHVGGTTTCETLWMGVPVVTKVGPAFQERLSYSNLTNAGLPELCAITVEDYVNKAVALARDRPLRQAMRTGLRGMIRMKPLGQSERFTRNFYAEVERVVAE